MDKLSTLKEDVIRGIGNRERGTDTVNNVEIKLRYQRNNCYNQFHNPSNRNMAFNSTSCQVSMVVELTMLVANNYTQM